MNWTINFIRLCNPKTSDVEHASFRTGIKKYQPLQENTISMYQKVPTLTREHYKHQYPI